MLEKRKLKKNHRQKQSLFFGRAGSNNITVFSTQISEISNSKFTSGNCDLLFLAVMCIDWRLAITQLLQFSFTIYVVAGRQIGTGNFFLQLAGSLRQLWSCSGVQVAVDALMKRDQ